MSNNPTMSSKAAKKKGSHTLQGKRKEASDPSKTDGSKEEVADYPRRNIDRLYCPAITYLCAIGALPSPEDSQGQCRPCVPCAYKICNFDIALDSDFSTRIPNQRPEQCPRSIISSHQKYNVNSNDLDGTMGYHRGMNVLTVGDGDFTFSLAVARLVVGDTKGSKSNARDGMVVATSYEGSQTLRRVYPDFDNTLESLKSCGENNVIIGYNVDATRLDDTLPKEVQHTSKDNNGGPKFHRICWNFPCTAIGGGQDGQNDAMEQNKELVRKFVVNALPYLDEVCGEIHMAHKTKPPYNAWGLEKVALEGIERSKEVLSNHGTNLEFKGRIAFDKCTLSPYTPRKALDRKSFPCHDACIYVFGWKRKDNADDASKSSKSKESEYNRSTITENQMKMRDSDDEFPKPSSIIPVTEDVIEKVRSTHLQNAQQRSEQHNKKRSESRRGGARNNKRRKKH